MISPLMNKEFLKKLFAIKQREVYAKIISYTWDEVPIEEVTGAITQGSVNVDGNSAVRRTCSLSMVVKDQKITDYYWAIKTKFKLYTGLTNTIDPSYPDIIWFPHGMFVINSFSKSQNVNNYTISINGKDKMALLDGTLGGLITASSVDFGKIETLLDDGTIVYEKLKLKDIIKEAVHEYAREPFHNIIINDLDKDGLELLEYKGVNPLYLILDENNNVYNLTQDENFTVYTQSGSCLISDSQKITYDKRISTLDSDNYIPATKISLIDSDNGNDFKYTITKLEYGDTAGYRLTDLVYAGDLIANVGSSITSGVLDKIKQMLGEYEYFYDIEGRFIFQAKKTYINTSWTPNQGAYIENNIEAAPYEYSLENNEIISVFNTNPDILNIKNDFSIWGTRKGVSGADIPIHLRFAIDKKPKKYTAIIDGITYEASSQFSIDKNNRTVYCDWRELIYRMALDYRKYYHNNIEGIELISKIRELNPDEFPTGYTGYELYYTDLEGFWRQIYNPYETWQPSETRGIPKVFLTEDEFIVTESSNSKWEDIRGRNLFQSVLANQLNNLTDEELKEVYAKVDPGDIDLTYIINLEEKFSGNLRHPGILSSSVKSVKGKDYYMVNPKQIEIESISCFLCTSADRRGDTNNYEYFIENKNNIIAKMNIYNLNTQENQQYNIIVSGFINPNIATNKQFTFYQNNFGSSQITITKDTVEDDEAEEVSTITEDTVEGDGVEGDIIETNPPYVINSPFAGNDNIRISFSPAFEKTDPIFIQTYAIIQNITLKLNYNNEFDSHNVYKNIYNSLKLSEEETYFYKDENNNYKIVQPIKETTFSALEQEDTLEPSVSSQDGKLEFIDEITFTGKSSENANAWAEIRIKKGSDIDIDNDSIIKEFSIEANRKLTYSFKKDEHTNSILPQNYYLHYSSNISEFKATYLTIDGSADEETFKKTLSRYGFNKNNLYYNDGNYYPFLNKVKSYSSNKFYILNSSNQWKSLTKDVDYYVIPDWEQPDSANGYSIGDKVFHNEKTWKSTINNNTSEPGPAANGWQEESDKKITLVSQYNEILFDEFGQPIGSLVSVEPRIQYARYDETDPYHVNYPSNFVGWHSSVVDNPSQLNFWIDFLDTGGEVEKFATYNVGNRPKATNDSKVKGIYFKDIPNIIYYNDEQIDSDVWSGYTTVYLPDNMEQMFSISSQGKSARDVLNEYLYNNTYAIENVSLTTIPIYILQPNTRIKIKNDEVDAEYIVTKFTIPLAYNGTMSITANKIADSIL